MAKNRPELSRSPKPPKPNTSGTRLRRHAHHVREWERHGATDISNTVLLCVRHHHAVHEGGWTVTPVDEADPLSHGYWQFTPPVRQARP